jgi:hypothetical protein
MTSSFAAAQPVIIDDVRQAAARLASRARRTPVFTVRVDGRPVTLKLEFMQVTGAFKFRGAFNAIATAAGAAQVITASPAWSSAAPTTPGASRTWHPPGSGRSRRSLLAARPEPPRPEPPRSGGAVAAMSPRWPAGQALAPI